MSNFPNKPQFTFINELQGIIVSHTDKCNSLSLTVNLRATVA